MKTIIDLPDALAAEANQVALDHGTTLRDLVITGLRHEVTALRNRPRVDFDFPTAGGSGLVEGVTHQDLIALAAR